MKSYVGKNCRVINNDEDFVVIRMPKELAEEKDLIEGVTAELPLKREKGNKYYYIDSELGQITQTYDIFGDSDNIRYKTGNYFGTMKAAQRTMLEETLNRLVRREAEMAKEEDIPSNDIREWFIDWSCEKRSFVACSSFFHKITAAYFPSLERALDVIHKYYDMFEALAEYYREDF